MHSVKLKIIVKTNNSNSMKCKSTANKQVFMTKHMTILTLAKLKILYHDIQLCYYQVNKHVLACLTRKHTKSDTNLGLSDTCPDSEAYSVCV